MSASEVRSGCAVRAALQDDASGKDEPPLMIKQAYRISELLAALQTETTLLRKWANESRSGGWSTHQVDPMRRRADELDEIIHKATQR